MNRLIVRGLKTEYADTPLGIDRTHPRLGWQLEAEGRARKQTAYRIIVGTREEVEAGIGGMWDTQKVISRITHGIRYSGQPLNSVNPYFWRVKVWDENDISSPWSDISSWSMGLLDDAEWRASWIEMPQDDENVTFPDLSAANWIGLRRISGGDQVFHENRVYFRKKIALSDLEEGQQALLLFSAETKPFLYINGHIVHSRASLGYRKLVLLDITQELTQGINVIALSVENTPRLKESSGACFGLLYIKRRNGDCKVSATTDSSWKVSHQPNNMHWYDLRYNDSHWESAHELAEIGEQPWEVPFEFPIKIINHHQNHVYYTRKAFNVQQKVTRATLFASALGIYEPRINGEKAGKDVLAPGWTDYNKRVMYQTYDVTEQIQIGSNTLASIIGEGWYAGNIGPFEVAHYGTNPKLIMQLHLELTDGSTQIVFTDSTWKISRGPLEYADLVHGEIYDARKEMPGWDCIGFDDQDWRSAREKIVQGVTRSAQIGPAVQIIEDLFPKQITQLADDVHVIDLGQNISGWVKLQVDEPEGKKITLRYAEMLQEDGTIYTENLRSARQTDQYIASGQGSAWYEPRFTFHGFRYVEVRGVKRLQIEQVIGRVVHSAAPFSGRIETSNRLINRLYENIVWGQRGNFLSVPTDCPQRDERLGWLGDAQVFAGTAAFNMDVRGFFEKWLIDVADAQFANGAYTDIAPYVGGVLRGGTAAWADAGVIVPWTMYVMYGDKQLLQEHYPSMTRYMAYLEQESPDGIRPAEGYGDWLSIGEETPKDLLATAFYAYSSNLMSEIADVLGLKADAEKYRSLFLKIRHAFNEVFVENNGRLKGHTQTGYVLALKMDLLDPNMAAKAVNHLLANIEQKGNHLATGFIGVSALLPILTETGHSKTAYDLFLNQTFPSWLYSVLQGATTIWERWDGWTTNEGFQTPAMNSFNHYSLGSVGEWMYRYMAGIHPDEQRPGFSEFQIKPYVDQRLSFVKAEYASVAGLISSSWELSDEKLVIKVRIPVNTTAKVYIPSENTDEITESGMKAVEAEGMAYLGCEDGRSVFRLSSGTYHFELPQ